MGVTTTTSASTTTTTRTMKNHLSCIMLLAHAYRRTGMSKAEALKASWTYAKANWQYVTFTKKSGDTVTRLVYTTSHNQKAVRGGVRTCPATYTLHIEVQNGTGDTLNDFHPLTAKWLACENQAYAKI